MATQHPLTVDQLHQIKRDLADMQIRAEEIFHIMAASSGELDARTVRAEELTGAIQRLQWAMERSSQSKVAAAAG
jgi:hypothetical protein